MSDNTRSGAVPGGRFAAVVDRLHALHPRLIDLSLGRLERLLQRLGHPERHLPPTIHVAGTNGKGSTCAFLRAIGEAQGWPVHVFTSPHLVRFNERIRLAGALVEDAVLDDTLEHVERVNEGAPITVFEVITAAALVLFARVPARLCVIEVGLGGRFDATNVIPPPRACAIASISMDHKELLGDTLGKIAFEKAGILKPGAPAVTGAQRPEALSVILDQAAARGVALRARGRDWEVVPRPGGLAFHDQDGRLDLPTPSLPGPHQADNAGIAVAAIRAAGLAATNDAVAQGIGAAEWPARLQRLHGRLAGTLPTGWELWLDGGHNPGAAAVLAEHLAGWHDRPLHLIVGMKATKDPAEFLRPLLPYAATAWAVAEPGQHLAVPVERIVAASGGVARPGPTIAAALAALPRDAPARVLICGSLYLAGEVLKAEAG